jgi:hypothetical protein
MASSAKSRERRAQPSPLLLPVFEFPAAFERL